MAESTQVVRPKPARPSGPGLATLGARISAMRWTPGAMRFSGRLIVQGGFGWCRVNFCGGRESGSRGGRMPHSPFGIVISFLDCHSAAKRRNLLSYAEATISAMPRREYHFYVYV